MNQSAQMAGVAMPYFLLQRVEFERPFFSG